MILPSVGFFSFRHIAGSQLRARSEVSSSPLEPRDKFLNVPFFFRPASITTSVALEIHSGSCMHFRTAVELYQATVLVFEANLPPRRLKSPAFSTCLKPSSLI